MTLHLITLPSGQQVVTHAANEAEARVLAHEILHLRRLPAGTRVEIHPIELAHR